MNGTIVSTWFGNSLKIQYNTLTMLDLGLCKYARLNHHVPIVLWSKPLKPGPHEHRDRKFKQQLQDYSSENREDKTTIIFLCFVFCFPFSLRWSDVVITITTILKLGRMLDFIQLFSPLYFMIMITTPSEPGFITRF